MESKNARWLVKIWTVLEVEVAAHGHEVRYRVNREEINFQEDCIAPSW